MDEEHRQSNPEDHTAGLPGSSTCWAPTLNIISDGGRESQFQLSDGMKFSWFDIPWVIWICFVSFYFFQAVEKNLLKETFAAPSTTFAWKSSKSGMTVVGFFLLGLGCWGLWRKRSHKNIEYSYQKCSSSINGGNRISNSDVNSFFLFSTFCECYIYIFIYLTFILLVIKYPVMKLFIFGRTLLFLKMYPQLLFSPLD